MGLRERKKEKTRKMISDLAAHLFVKRGYHAVTMADVAAEADVSVSTVFNYFPTKESLIFDLEDEIETDIVAAIQGRKKGETILHALHRYFLSSQLFNPPNTKNLAGFTRLVRTSPELSAYLRGLWGRYESTLAKEIISATKTKKAEAECISKLIFEAISFACNSNTPKETLNVMFKLLKSGWDK